MARSLVNAAIVGLLFGVSVCVAAQQDPSTQSADPSSQQQPTAQPSNPVGSGQQQAGADQGQGTQDQATQDKKSNNNEEKPGALKRLKRHLRQQVSSGCVNAVGNHCWDKPPADDTQSSKDNQQTTQSAANTPSQRSDDATLPSESSSRSTKIDLSPPPGEAAPPGVGVDPSEAEVREFKPWNPHKADKNVEVGDFYFKLGNYPAAESRYEEALYWNDRDAIAMFRLAEAQEKLGKFSKARTNYAAYLKILPEGEFAKKANEGLQRLKNKPDAPVAVALPQP
jgi:tetratricopeptide (TPR) repeat protein